MKLVLILIATATLLCSCTNHDKKSKNNANELIYNSESANSGILLAELSLKGDMPQKELLGHIKLTNSGSKDIDIQEIVVSTSEGLRSLPAMGFMPFSLEPGKDTTFSIKFNPLNDLKTYQVTGMQGYFKQAYAVSVSYKTAGNDNVQQLIIKSQAEKNEYNDYAVKYKKQLTGYSFNTKTDFAAQQKKYLETLKDIQQPPFVYVSNQEIAISGLNFRLKSYYQKDTLYAELFVVNHAGFPVKIVRENLDIITSGKPTGNEAKTIAIEKVSGDQQDINMMKKGDRVLIHFKKHIQLSNDEALVITLPNAFLLTGKKTLFYADAQLAGTRMDN